MWFGITRCISFSISGNSKREWWEMKEENDFLFWNEKDNWFSHLKRVNYLLVWYPTILILPKTGTLTKCLF